MLVTVFLAVLIIALALGNTFLSLLKPRQQAQSIDSPATEAPLGLGRPQEDENVISLNRRLDRLENLLLKVNGAPFLGKKLNGTKLGQKLNGLEEFKDNTKLEIAALKQELARVKNQLGIQEKKNPREDYPISSEELHGLAFRVGKNKS